ncbi:MAG: hypothetical protein H6719_25795, partial [Sandaracinaceae bacterium]|nr:hypothetical protein [Sandaracinaceae bacterium]
TDWRIEPCVGEGEDTCRFETITVDGRERGYVVSRRGGFDCSGGERPIVLAFHGNGGNGAALRESLNDAARGLAFEEVVGGRALVVYPDGLDHSDCDGHACWNRDPEGYDVAFVQALIARLAADYCVDPSQVFVLGHSRGGRFVEVLACHRGGALRAAASISAGGGNVDACPDRLPMWLSHGVHDQTIAFAEGEAHRDDWAARNGCAPATSVDYPLDTCTTLAGCPDASPVVWCPNTERDWEGHAIPSFADEAIVSFFSSTP